ncbi:MAG TPA: hypothetical protein EYQ63_10965 [Fuerstia sp.]|nr:hypothetical protein [Fuerstiella sp.]
MSIAVRSTFISLALAFVAACSANVLRAQPLRFDCGTPASPVMSGYQRLTAGDDYSTERGYGWQDGFRADLEFSRPTPDPELRGSNTQFLLQEPYDLHRTPLNRDAVTSQSDLTFRIDLPNGDYRVAITMGDLSREIGSIDLSVNDQPVADHLAVWSPGGYRMLDRTPAGWWTTFRTTVRVADGVVRIQWSSNQSHYDTQLAEQATWETPYAKWYHRTPIIREPPYHYIGYPFSHHSVMAIEVTAYRRAPVEIIDGKLAVSHPIASAALARAIEQFNAGDFNAALISLQLINEPAAQVARATLALHLAGSLHTESEFQLVPQAIAILRPHVAANPEDHAAAELLADAEIFQKAMSLHVHRYGELESNHFLGNDRAIGWWWTIQPDSPLRDKSRLQLARAAHMLKPYYPILGTEGQVFAELEKKAPHNRFIRYHLRQEWETTGDGSNYYDWTMVDYAAKTSDAPRWAAAIYPAYAGLVDLSEWWLRYKQTTRGDIGGGWSDDVELVGLFGYYGHISRGASNTCVAGTAKLCEGVWNLSEVDPELGYSELMSDAEHSAEPTGNTLGMMMQLDYGNPLWIERSMKTGKLIRDLWTDYNDAGHRHFRANFFNATQVGSGDRANDSWINYRAVSPASSVLNYNQNPVIAGVYVELAEAWLAAALSTDGGKPRGVIPAQVSFPQAGLGGHNAPNWFTADHPPRTVNYDWLPQTYKGYVVDILLAAYRSTGKTKFLEPLRLEYELAVRHGFPPREPGEPTTRPRSRTGRPTKAPVGSEAWVAAKLLGLNGAPDAGDEFNAVDTSGQNTTEHLRRIWPIMTSEAGPTDRVGFHGMVDPFFIYTGGKAGGPLLKAAVTYENTTRDFAAAVLAHDSQGLRILYYSFAPDTREINIVPWDLEPGGRYQLIYGVDDQDDGVMDTVTERREFDFAQAGAPVPITVRPATNYIIRIEQRKRGRPAGLRPDPAVSSDDIRFDPARDFLKLTVHNVGSAPVRNVRVLIFDGDPTGDGRQIYQTRIPHIAAPIDLEPRTVTVGVHLEIGDTPRDIHVLLDPDGLIENEITTFNNRTRALVPRPQRSAELRINAAGATPSVGK